MKVAIRTTISSRIGLMRKEIQYKLEEAEDSLNEMEKLLVKFTKSSLNKNDT